MAPSKSPPKTRPQQTYTAHATISARWLLTGIAISVLSAAFCTWVVFCVLFWQGSWQLLYHPTSVSVRTPSNIGLSYDPISFAIADNGVSQLQGWWIPASSARYTALYLHGRAGNLGDTLNALSDLHAAGLNVFAFDYRGYGQSNFEHPSEVRWRQDATWALDYLTGTRHIDPHSIVIVGSDLGANLALETAAAHPELAGVVLESPLDSPASAIFNDARAKLVPARLLFRDRYDLAAPAAAVHVPSLWVTNAQDATQTFINSIFEKVSAPKTRIVLGPVENITNPLQSWLAHLEK